MESGEPVAMKDNKENNSKDESNEEDVHQEENKKEEIEGKSEDKTVNEKLETKPEKRSHHVILEAKPQHFGPAMVELAENEKITDVDTSNYSNSDSRQLPMSGVMLPADTDGDGPTTIVQYAVDPKVEGEAIQVYLFLTGQNY